MLVFCVCVCVCVCLSFFLCLFWVIVHTSMLLLLLLLFLLLLLLLLLYMFWAITIFFSFLPMLLDIDKEMMIRLFENIHFDNLTFKDWRLCNYKTYALKYF